MAFPTSLHSRAAEKLCKCFRYTTLSICPCTPMGCRLFYSKFGICHCITPANGSEHLEIVVSITERDGIFRQNAIMIAEQRHTIGLGYAASHYLAKHLVRTNYSQIRIPISNSLFGPKNLVRPSHEQELVDPTPAKHLLYIATLHRRCLHKELLASHTRVAPIVNDPRMKTIRSHANMRKRHVEKALDRRSILNPNNRARKLSPLLIEHVCARETDERPGKTQRFLHRIQAFGRAR